MSAITPIIKLHPPLERRVPLYTHSGAMTGLPRPWLDLLRHQKEDIVYYGVICRADSRSPALSLICMGIAGKVLVNILYHYYYYYYIRILRLIIFFLRSGDDYYTQLSIVCIGVC